VGHDFQKSAIKRITDIETKRIINGMTEARGSYVACAIILDSNEQYIRDFVQQLVAKGIDVPWVDSKTLRTKHLPMPPPYRNPNRNAESGGSGVEEQELVDAYELYGGRLTRMVALHNYEGARSVLEEAERKHHNRDLPDMVMDMPLSEIGVPVRTCNCLETHAAVVTVKQLFLVEFAKLYAIPNVGILTVQNMFWCICKAFAQRDIERDELLRDKLSK